MEYNKIMVMLKLVFAKTCQPWFKKQKTKGEGCFVPIFLLSNKYQAEMSKAELKISSYISAKFIFGTV